MEKVVKLSGKKCSYYIEGHCLYEEALNPGYNKKWICSVYTALEAQYDKLLLQAESFKLSHEQMSRMWYNRLNEQDIPTSFCAVSVTSDDNDYPFCVHCINEVCILKLPVCGGICFNYLSEDEEL